MPSDLYHRLYDGIEGLPDKSSPSARQSLTARFLQHLRDTHAGAHDGYDNAVQECFLLAASEGLTDLARALLSVGARLDADGSGQQGALPRSALRWAVENCEHRGAEVLLSLGAKEQLDVIEEGRERTPLHQAVLKMDVKMVKLLLAAGANVNARINSRGILKGETPLHTAAIKGNAEITGLLLDAGAKVNARNKQGDSPLHLAAAAGGAGDVCALLLDHGARIDTKGRRGLPALSIAAEMSDADAAVLLLDRGADPALEDSKGRRPLHYAVMQEEWRHWGGYSITNNLDTDIKENRQTLVRALLAAGADINATDKKGWTPLFLIVKSGNDLALAGLLLERGANVRYCYERGRTALEWLNRFDFKQYSKRRLMELLLVSDPQQRLPDHLQIDKTMLEALLCGGVPPDVLWAAAKDMYRSQPFRVQATERREMLEMLLGAGLDLEVTDGAGDTLLHHLCRAGAPAEDIGLLLEAGDNRLVNLRNRAGETPLLRYTGYAPAPGVGAVRRLLEAGADESLTDGDGKGALALLNERRLGDRADALKRYLLDSGCTHESTAEETGVGCPSAV